MKARGFVLAGTLWMLSLLSAIALAVAFMGRLELKSAGRRQEGRQAELAARSALTFVEQKLRKLDGSYFALDLLDGQDSWESGQLPALPFAFTVKLTDESGKLDLNRATSQMLEALGFTKAQAAAVCLWREDHPFATVWELTEALSIEDLAEVAEQASLLTTVSQAENLNPNGKPKLVLGRLSSEELLAASGGEISPSLAGRLASGAGRGITELGQLLQIAQSKEELAQLVDWLAEEEGVSRGKLNLNTAPLEVLQVIPGFGAELSQAILQRRAEAPFKRLSELVLLPEFPLSSWEKCADWVTVSSCAFLLEAEGTYRRGKHKIAAVFGQGRYLDWQEE